MVTRFRLPRVTATRLEERSVSTDDVLRQAGLSPGLLREEKCFLTTEQLFAFWQAVGEVSSDPAIGLSLGSESRIERMDLVQLAALSASSLRDALARAARYKQLSCPEELAFDVRGNECVVRFRWLLADALEPTILTDLCFSWITTLAAKGTGGAVRPKRVEFGRAARHRELYAEHFGCRVRFKAPENALIFHSADLDRPFLTHNADLLDILAPQLDAELAERAAEQDARAQVQAVLRRLLVGRRPDLGDVARELASSPRTLQRRLGDLGVSYHRVLEDSRRSMARQYLLHSALELSEIAYLLGYEDANSFFRAFTRWEGMPPGRWRDSHRIEGATPALRDAARPPTPERRRVQAVSGVS